MKTKNSIFGVKAFHIIYLLVTVIFIVAGCQEAEEGPGDVFPDTARPPEALFHEGQVHGADMLDSADAEKLSESTLLQENDEVSNLKVAASTYVHFGDETACIWNPNICANTFVMWPGYIQSTGYNEWGYAWMSNGPYGGFISYGTGDHYHIGGLAFPETEPNPKHSSMFGTDWFAFYMQRSGSGRINFDLQKITVKGSTPITLWFRRANGSVAYWPSLGSGTWNFGNYAKNIKEFHVRSANGHTHKNYSLDNILVKGL